MKKKLLAFLLAVLMVASVVSTTAVPVVAAGEPNASVGASRLPVTQTLSGDNAQTPPPVTYPEVDRANAVAELLDENGEFLANFEALSDAVSYVKDGYTIRLLKDISTAAALNLNVANVSWTLDAVKEDGTAALYAYTGTGYALVLDGAAQKVTVKGLVLNSAAAGIQANSGTAMLENVQIRCDGTSADNVAGNGGSSIAVAVAVGAYVRVSGADTVMQTVKGNVINNKGSVAIQDGYYYIHSSTSTNSSSDQYSALILVDGGAATADLYGGTFVAGSEAKSVLMLVNGATGNILDGLYIYDGRTAPITKVGRKSYEIYHLFRVAQIGSATLSISGGDFYSIREGSAIIAGDESKYQVNIYAGNFYADVASDLTTTQIGAIYKASEAVLADNGETADVIENQFVAGALGVPEGEAAAALTFTCAVKQWVEYDFENETLKNAYYAFEVTNGDSAQLFYNCEMERAFLALGDGGVFALLCNMSLDAALNLPVRSAGFEWTLTSAGEATYTLTVTVKSTNTTANKLITDGYAIYVNGGILNLENIRVTNPEGGVFVLSGESTLNVKKGTEISFGVSSTSISTNAICVSRGNVNIYEGAYIYPPTVKNMVMALVRLFGPSELTIHKGAKVGYNTNDLVPDESGGYLIWLNHKDAVAHIYGEIAADYGRAINARDYGDVDGENVNGGTLYIYDGAKLSAKRSNAGVITVYDNTIYVYGGEFHQPTTAGAENSIFMVVPSGKNKTNIYIKGGTFYDSVSNNGRMLMSKADSYIEITGGTFYAVSHSIFLMKDVAPKVVVKNGVDADGNVISVPHFYGPNGKPIVDLRQNAKMEISGGYFWANYAGPLIQMYAAGLTITGGDFTNIMGDMISIKEQTGDASKTITINDVYIDGANATFNYKRRFLDVANELSAVDAAGTNAPGARTVTVKNVTVSGESHFLYMKSCLAHVIFENVTATTTAAEGMWITSGVGSITFNNCNLTSEHGALLYVPSSDTTAYHITFNGGTYRAATYAIRCLARTMADENGAMTGITINDGTFKPYDDSKPMTACISMEAGQCTINGGEFISNGACVVYAGSGEVNTYLDRIYKRSTAYLTVNGGSFVLAENGRGVATDAVMKVGNETAYATVTVTGGDMIIEREGCEQLIENNNEFSVVSANG